jgi:hypothetical protein
VYVGGMGRWAKNAEFCLVVENWQTQVQCLPASLSAFRPCPWGLYFVGGGHGLSAQSVSKPPQQALVGWALQPTGFLLSFCRDPYTTVLASSCQGGKATTTMSFSAWAPCCLYFSAGPCQTLSYVTSHNFIPTRLWKGVPRLPELWLFLVFKSSE